MTDIHAHVLHNFDDGPAALENSIELIKDCQSKGITRIVTTSHYYSSRMPQGEFLGRRKRRLKELREALGERGIDVELISGAEVNISDILLNQEMIHGLCCGESKNILLEIPTRYDKFSAALDLMEKISSFYSVNPIVAHIERYPFIEKHRENVTELRNRGFKLQIDAQVLLDKSLFLKNRILGYIQDGLVDFVASDCHGDKKRPQNLPEAYKVIEQKLGAQYVKKLMDNAEGICD